jgi:hypothetical protein
MRAELVECWLCEETIVPDAARIRYRDEQGRVHPWADRRGRWAPEYICSACALVYPDCMEYDWSGVTACFAQRVGGAHHGRRPASSRCPATAPAIHLLHPAHIGRASMV